MDVYKRAWGREPPQPLRRFLPPFAGGSLAGGTGQGFWYDGRAGRSQIVPTAGKNWSMPTHLSVQDSVIIGPNVFPSVTTVMFNLHSELKTNAEGIVQVILAASS